MEVKKGRLAKELEDPFYLKDSNLIELYKKCLPPKEAYYYFPKGEEMIEYNKKKPKKSYRKIYHNVQMLDNEKQYLVEFKKILSEHPEVKLPNFIDDDLLLRFIYAEECEYDKVLKRLKKYIEWNNKTFPIIIQPKSRLIELLNKGVVYVYGRDCRYRPILVFRLQEFVKNEKIYSVQEVIETGCFLGQFVINNMMIPGQVERWILIINLKGATVLSLPEHIKKLIPVMNEAFISRLHKNYVIGMTFFLRILYKLVCAFLHESTIKKIKIIGGKKDKSLFEEIRKDNIEQNMGGTAPDAHIGEQNALFPPRMPSEHFLLESESPENILISEEQYIQKYKNGEIPDDLASPYILEKLNINNKSNNPIISDEKEKKIELEPKLIKNEKISNTSTNPSKNIKSIENNHILNEKQLNMNNEKIIQSQKSSQKEYNINKVKTFLYHGWDNFYDHENPIKYKNPKNSQINDIYSLSIKKQNYFSKITKMSNKNNIYSQKTYFINGHI